MLVDDALRALDLVRSFDGPIVDVGSGGGSPGIPLAQALPEREVTLLEASRRKCDFLERWAPPNARVVWGRAEEQEPDAYGLALAKALAPPPVAAELCLSLVRPGGAAILWVGPSADLSVVGRVSSLLVPGGSFVLDAPDTPAAVWGTGKDVLWAEGEALMIAGPQGVGKTTLANQLIKARLGLVDMRATLPRGGLLLPLGLGLRRHVEPDAQGRVPRPDFQLLAREFAAMRRLSEHFCGAGGDRTHGRRIMRMPDQGS